ncbi:MAG TPA: hypothetical protein VF338_05155 [Leptolinea sp.]
MGFVYDTPGGLVGKVLTEINRCRAVLPLIRAVQDFAPDLIYLRWGMYVFPSQRIFKIAPVVVEINTNDVSQHEMLGAVLSFYNRLTRGIFLSRAAGLVYTSSELEKCESFAAYHRPGIVIANGIDMTRNTSVPAPHNIRPRIGFIGTPDLPWQGVDKLIRLAMLCPDLDIDVIGFDSFNDGQLQPSNLYFHGYLDQEKSREILSGVDIGLGTIALHRKAMNEASPLKTREYLAYGIPVIVPYQDTDLDDLNIDTILRLQNTEDNMEQNWKRIRDFAIKMQGQRVDRAKISHRIDSEIKEQTRLKFFTECSIRNRTVNEFKSN